MGEYIYSVVCVSAAIGIASAVAPEGIRGGLKKHMKLIAGLCLLCVMIGPIVGAIDTIRDTFDAATEGINGEGEDLRGGYENIYKSYLEGEYGDNVALAVKDCLLERFSIPGDECRVRVDFDNELIEPEKITVILSGRSVLRDPKEIKSFVRETFGCECSCAVDWGEE